MIDIATEAKVSEDDLSYTKSTLGQTTGVWDENHVKVLGVN